jgi:tetratricopeptide (TPR) repeat protein
MNRFPENCTCSQEPSLNEVAAVTSEGHDAPQGEQDLISGKLLHSSCTRAAPAASLPLNGQGASAAAPFYPETSTLAPSRVQFGLAGMMRWSERFVDRMVNAYERLFCLTKEDAAEIYLQIGATQARSGRGAQAVAALNQTVKIQPDNGLAWYQLGMVHLQQEACAAAVAAFERAHRLGCDDYELHYAMAQALSDLERYEEAITELYLALERKPEAAEAAYSLGVALDQLKRYEEAAAAFKIAIAHAPREVSYYQSLGFTLESMGHRDEAIQYFKRAITLERRG